MECQQKNKVILFDFFGVISSEVSPIFFKRYFNEEEAKIVKEEIMSKGDKGELSEEEIYELIAKRVNETPLKVKEDFKELIHINYELVSYIKELKKEYRIYLLSNAVSSFLRRILKENNLYELFNEVYISGEIKLIKPYKEYFNYVIEKENLDPSMCIMIDDNKKNIEGAISCNLNGIVFTNNKDLKEKLDIFLKGV
jgi:putative hydrolase of the HAD superfamily